MIDKARMTDFDVCPTGARKVLSEQEIRIRELTEEITALKAKLCCLNVAIQLTDEQLEHFQRAAIELGELLQRERS